MKYIIVLIVLALLGMVAFVIYGMFFPFKAPENEKVKFHIQYGTSVSLIAQQLEAEQIIKSAKWFEITTRVFNKSKDIKAGIFEMPKHISVYQAMIHLAEGKQAFIKITIPEGLDQEQIAGIFARKMNIDSTRFISLVEDSAFVESLNIDAPSLQGYLYPETYYFTFGVDEDQIINEMVHQFHKQCPDSADLRAQDLGYSFYEILVLASIIQGEAVIDSEMIYISSVYHNRLENGIPLQADPTIQYIISDGPRRLLNRDLEIDSPFNTYLYPGLPPSPINNPGINAILAALYPADTPYYYFVADGSGGHIFSTTLRQHLRAKREFDKIRRKVARMKKNKKDSN